jgi:hypothetical protein
MPLIRLYLLFLCFSYCSADVKGLDGTIHFDTESDSQPDMTLNATGLGIGISPSTNLQVAGNAIVSEQIFIGGCSGSSNLNLHGSMAFGYQSISANAVLDATSIVLADTSSDNITLTLPSAGNVSGRAYTIKKTSFENNLWINGGGNLIDDSSPVELGSSSSLGVLKVISDGQQWHIISSSDVSDTIASENLVGWWKFDELDSNGNTIDSSNYGQSGNLVNNPSLVSGKFNTGYDFDGASNYIDFGDPDHLDSFDQIALSCWVKTSNASGGAKIIMGKSANAVHSNPYYTYTMAMTGGRAHLRLNTTSITGSVVISDGQWHHIVCNYNGAQMQIYVDGSLDTSTAKTGALTTSNQNFRIGGRHTTALGEFYGDIVDDARIFNRALTPAEILVLSQQAP